jgi:AsmA protein
MLGRNVFLNLTSVPRWAYTSRLNRGGRCQAATLKVTVKRWVRILLAVAGLIAVVAASLPLFVNANTFRPAIEKQLSAVLGRSVKLGALRLPPFSGSLIAEDVSVADDPDFSAAPFLTAKEVRIGVSLHRLILSHEVHLRSFQIESPQITVIRAANGSWNFSSIGRAAVAPTATTSGVAGISKKSAQALADLSVGRLVIEDGRAVVSTLPSHGEPTVYDHVNLTARDFSFGAQFPFELGASLPAGGTLSATGHIGPINRDDVATSPADAQISVKALNPVAAGFLSPEAGVSVVADVEMHAASDGQTLATDGTIQLQNLKLRKGAAAAPKPLDLSYRGSHRLRENTGEILDASAKIGNAEIHASGTYQPLLNTVGKTAPVGGEARTGAAEKSATAQSTSARVKGAASGANSAAAMDDPLLNLKLAGQNLPIDELQPLMTAAGIRLPNGSRLKGGTLSLNLAIAGQARALTISGAIALDNTRLVGFDISTKVHGIAALGGVKSSDTTEFEKLRADVRMTNAGVTVTRIEAVIPAMGELSGSGTVSAADQLDFNLVMTGSAVSGIGKVGVGLLSALNGSSGSKSGVPLRVTGTPDDPNITADVGGIVGKKTKSIASFFGGGKKK